MTGNCHMKAYSYENKIKSKKGMWSAGYNDVWKFLAAHFLGTQTVECHWTQQKTIPFQTYNNSLMENAGFENDSHIELFMNIRTKSGTLNFVNLDPNIIFIYFPHDAWFGKSLIAYNLNLIQKKSYFAIDTLPFFINISIFT